MARTKKQEQIEEFKVKKISPFDIINYIFTNDVEFNKLSDAILDQNFFIINRIFSIKYPLQAQAFNKLGISTSDVIKFWKIFLNAKESRGRVPYWCYTKGSKRAQETIEKNVEIKSADVKALAEYYNTQVVDAKVFTDLFPTEATKELDRLKEINSIREMEKQISKVK